MREIPAVAAVATGRLLEETLRLLDTLRAPGCDTAATIEKSLLNRRQKAALLEQGNAPRLILQSAHPSPLSSYRGFFGSRPFSGINAFLRENGCAEIHWQID